MGVPTLGCGCAVCTSPDPHDRRLRPSALIRWNEPGNAARFSAAERVVVIDTGPDFREQALRSGNHPRRRRALHALPRRPHPRPRRPAPAQLRRLSRRRSHPPLRHGRKPPPSSSTSSPTPSRPTPRTPTAPASAACPLAERNPIHGVDFLRVPVLHGQMQIVGYRFGRPPTSPT
jgi:phosphoribosyl 1,2-cyclic phosphate phosphodiesterase